MGAQGTTAREPRSRRDARAVLSSLRRLVRFLRLADRRSELSHGVSAAQLFVLQSLAEAPAGSLAELAERTLTDQSSVSIVVNRLVERGLVARRAVAGDRRKVELALTARGRRAVSRGPDLAQVRIIEAIVRMRPELRRALVQGLDGLVHAIGADALAPHMLFEDEPRRNRKRRT